MLTDNDYLEALKAAGWDRSAAADALGIGVRPVQYRIKKLRRLGHQIPESPYTANRQEFMQTQARRAEVPDLPSGELTIDELLALREREFSRKEEFWEARKCIPIKVKIDGPFGIHFFGDPHLDDPGTDIRQLRKDVEIIKKSPAMLAANVGDTTNNWVGRLAVKYGDQQATKLQGWQLTEWFITELIGIWLFIVAGNHDLWSGAGDPLRWISRCAGTIYEASQVRIELKCSGDSIFVNTRHDFKGFSQFNPAHGPQKAAIFGYRDHLNVCGHQHTSGYGVWKDAPTGRICHNLRVAAYKVYDDYAVEKGLRDQHISPSATVVITPNAPERSKVQVFWDLEEAAAFLKFKRQRYDRSHAKRA